MNTRGGKISLSSGEGLSHIVHNKLGRLMEEVPRQEESPNQPCTVLRGQVHASRGSWEGIVPLNLDITSLLPLSSVVNPKLLNLSAKAGVLGLKLFYSSV